MDDESTTERPAPELTPNQRRFCSEYVIDRNATRAYQAAFPGTAYSTARSEGARLLANPSIRGEVDAAAVGHARRCGISARRVLRELAAVAFFDPADVFEANGVGL